MVALYILYTLGRAWLQPACAPAVESDTEAPDQRRLLTILGTPLILIVAVLGSILGGLATPTEAAAVGAVGALLFGGVSDLAGGENAAGPLSRPCRPWRRWRSWPTVAPVRLQRGPTSRAADIAIGTIGSVDRPVTSGSSRLGITASPWRALRAGVLRPVVTETMSISAMIFTTIIAASVFALVFRGLGGDERVQDHAGGAARRSDGDAAYSSCC